MRYLHIHFVWDRLFAWFAMVTAFPGRCVLNKRILLRSAAAPLSRQPTNSGFTPWPTEPSISAFLQEHNHRHVRPTPRNLPR